MPNLAFEPGRSIIGPAGVTLYEVGTTKPVADRRRRARHYVSVDGGMSDNARPALYGARLLGAHRLPRVATPRPRSCRVVGKHCESGDIVVDAEYLPGDVAPGDLLAVPATGAYCLSLASNYNYVPAPAGRRRARRRGPRHRARRDRSTTCSPATPGSSPHRVRRRTRRDARMIDYRRLRVALLGAGAVGSQVAALLLEHGDELADRAGARTRARRHRRARHRRASATSTCRASCSRPMPRRSSSAPTS